MNIFKCWIFIVKSLLGQLVLFHSYQSFWVFSLLPTVLCLTYVKYWSVDNLMYFIVLIFISSFIFNLNICTCAFVSLNALCRAGKSFSLPSLCPQMGMKMKLAERDKQEKSNTNFIEFLYAHRSLHTHTKLRSKEVTRTGSFYKQYICEELTRERVLCYGE